MRGPLGRSLSKILRRNGRAEIAPCDVRVVVVTGGETARDEYGERSTPFNDVGVGVRARILVGDAVAEQGRVRRRHTHR